VIVVYARDGPPPALVQTLAARRPGVDPADIVPVGMPALGDMLERFVEAGFSKFVLRPAAEPADWTAELEDLAAHVLPLQASALV
jgi:hypothetical protein